MRRGRSNDCGGCGARRSTIAEPVRVFKIDLRDGRGDSARAHSCNRTARLAAAVGVVFAILAAVGVAAWRSRALARGSSLQLRSAPALALRGRQAEVRD